MLGIFGGLGFARAFHRRGAIFAVLLAGALHLKSVPDDEPDAQDPVDGLPVPQLSSRDAGR